MEPHDDTVACRQPDLQPPLRHAHARTVHYGTPEGHHGRGTGRIGDLHESRAGCIYIHAVTQLEISSTEVRNLVAAGRDPRFLMPDSVRRIILESRCYTGPQR